MLPRIWIGVLALLGGCSALPGTPVGEVAELVGVGEEKPLREPMRPAQDGPRVLIFALDGVGDDVLRRAIAEGDLPNVARLLGPGKSADLYAHGYAAPGVLSVLPSTTIAAWSSLFTGEPPARTGIPGNEWFVRETGRFYAPSPVSLTTEEQAIRVYTDELLDPLLHARTLYERADRRAYVSLSHLHRGADLLIVPDAAEFGDLVQAVAKGLENGEVKAETYEELDRMAAHNLRGALRDYGVPDLQVAYFPGTDLYTHIAPQPLEAQRRYLREVIDPQIGKILEEYDRQGALDSTYVLVVSDHGHTPVLKDDRHALGTEGEDEPPALLRRAGFRVRPFELDPEPDERDFQAVVAYQGAMAYLYLSDRSTCPEPGDGCDWKRPPRLEEDVLPVVRAFDRANRFGEGVPELKGTLDLILAREPRAPGDDALPFQVWTGEQLVPVETYLERHPRPDLPALAERLEGLAAGPYGHYAGDVLLIARSGTNRPLAERFYFSVPYQSWHGSPSLQDSEIALLVAHRARSGAELKERVRREVGPDPSQLDITRLVLRLLGKANDRAPAAER